MKHDDYWRARFAALEAARYKDNTAAYSGIETQYRLAQRQLEGQISTWYQRFAKNNEVTLLEAKKMLTKGELAEFTWDVWDYIRYGQKLEQNPAWRRQLENASARVHISRLEALKLQTQQSLEVLFSNQLDELDQLARRVYAEGYYSTVFTVGRGSTLGLDRVFIDQNRLDKILSKPWTADGENFSHRIWENKQKLLTQIHTQLTQACILGEAPQVAIKNLAKGLKTSKYNAGRLFMTESAFFASAAQRDAFSDLGVDRYEVVATLDSRTSAICQGLDGKVFSMKDYAVGTTAPPFHVWCRSTTAPYFDDAFNVGKRAARGEDGKTYYVPRDMQYEDWKKAMVAELPEKGLQAARPGGIIELTKEEERGIAAYISSDSYPINYALRTKTALSQQQSETVMQLDAAMEKLPTYKGTVYRSMGLEYLDDVEAFFKRHAVGNYVKYEAFTSASARIYDETMDIQMIIVSKNASDLRRFNTREAELLFKRNSLFKVTQIDGNRIFMEEV